MKDVSKSTPAMHKASTLVTPLELGKKEVRRTVDPKTGEVLFSVVDIIAVLTESNNPRRYWSDLKKQLQREGSQLNENIVQLKLTSQDGKKYKTDVADMETIFRLVQSIPSKKAEPLKLWLAKTGRERVEEEIDPSRAIERAVKAYKRQGYTDEWIDTRIRTTVKRNVFTAACKDHGIAEPWEYAQLTDRGYQGWSGWNTAEFKKAKGLPPQVNLRNHMTAPQLTVTEVAENSATIIMAEKNANGFAEVAEAVAAGSYVARQTRAALEQVLGKSIVEGKPALPQASNN